VVVDDFDVLGVAALPAEADAVLVVDADAVLPLAVARQFLQSVAGRDAALDLVRTFGLEPAPRSGTEKRNG